MKANAHISVSVSHIIMSRIILLYFCYNYKCFDEEHNNDGWTETM